MKDEQGQLKTIDKALAHDQWKALKQIYINLGFKVLILDGQPGLPDMVFCANTFLSHPTKKRAMVSLMHSANRKDETIATKKYLEKLGYETMTPPDNLKFEGMGDALWDYENNILWGGYGHRTDKEVYDLIDKEFSIQTKSIQLISEDFYHFDTCMSILSKDTVAIVKEGISLDGLEDIKSIYKNIIEISFDEAKNGFAANCHSPNGKDLIIHPGNNRFEKDLRDLGFKIHHVDTSEYIKSGGSVFCMKHQLRV